MSTLFHALAAFGSGYQHGTATRRRREHEEAEARRQREQEEAVAREQQSFKEYVQQPLTDDEEARFVDLALGKGRVAGLTNPWDMERYKYYEPILLRKALRMQEDASSQPESAPSPQPAPRFGKAQEPFINTLRQISPNLYAYASSLASPAIGIARLARYLPQIGRAVEQSGGLRPFVTGTVQQVVNRLGQKTPLAQGIAGLTVLTPTTAEAGRISGKIARQLSNFVDAPPGDPSAEHVTIPQPDGTTTTFLLENPITFAPLRFMNREETAESREAKAREWYHTVIAADQFSKTTGENPLHGLVLRKVDEPSADGRSSQVKIYGQFGSVIMPITLEQVRKYMATYRIGEIKAETGKGFTAYTPETVYDYFSQP